MFPPKFRFKKQHALLTRFVPVYFRNFAEYYMTHQIQLLNFFLGMLFKFFLTLSLEKDVFEVLLSFFDFPEFLQLVHGISRGNP